jgi:hypothetical protein
VLSVNDSFRPVPLDQFPQALLPFDKREISKIFVIEPQKIERVENRNALSGEKLVELADAISVDTDNLAIQDRVLNPQLAQ